MSERQGENGHLGYVENFRGAVSVAIPLGLREVIADVRWGSAGLESCHGSYAYEDGTYKAAETFQIEDGVDTGTHLVLEQRNPTGDRIWHLNQDLIFALGLVEEGDYWVRPDENFVQVAKRERRDDGSVGAIYARADFLRDYLAARGMALRLLTYHQRTSVEQDASHIHWADNPMIDRSFDGRFEARTARIHPGNIPAGSSVAVFHVSRIDVDEGADIPEMGPETDEGTRSTSRTFQRSGPVIIRIEGEFWRDEWVEPAAHSPRVRGDRVPSATSFIVDAAGTRMSADALRDQDCGKWLWFDPAVVNDILKLRTGELHWYTHDTGGLRGEPGYDIHFGVNSIGLINVHAYDIAKLSEWHRQIWAGRNVYPQGGLCAELAASQIRAEPADTSAPEWWLPQLLERVDGLASILWGSPIFRPHAIDRELIASVHRFRASDRSSLLELAKDIARLTADRLDVATLHRLAPQTGNQGKGSLKSLERLLATVTTPEDARSKLSVLVGIYELRLGAAHLPSEDIEDAFALIGIDKQSPIYEQTLAMLEALGNALFEIGNVIKGEIDRRRAE